MNHVLHTILQGILRSLKVKLECGAEDRLHSSSEPSVCVYEATLTTPAVCSDDELKALQAEVDHLKALRAEVQAEIDADAAAALKDEL